MSTDLETALREMKERAEGATPGRRWRALVPVNSDIWHVDAMPKGQLVASTGIERNAFSAANAAHIAGCHPAAIKALVDVAEAALESTSDHDGWSPTELAKRADPATIERYHRTSAALARLSEALKGEGHD